MAPVPAPGGPPVKLIVGGTAVVALILAQTVVTSVSSDLTLAVIVGGLCFLMGRMSKK